MRGLIVVLILSISATLSAQIQMRPTEAPLVDATSEAWYQLREPLQFAGDLYYQAGASVFFNGNVMVRTGHYNGVPIYADATLEPYSIVFVLLVVVCSSRTSVFDKVTSLGPLAAALPHFP